MSSLSDGTLKISYLSKLWITIEEMPIWNWQQIIKGEGLSFLFKDQDKENEEKKELSELWFDLQDEHMREFGVDDMLRRRIKLMIKLRKLHSKFINTRERVLLNFIEMAEKELEAMDTGISVRFYKVLDAVTTYKGFRIDPKEYTVIEWYHALNNMSNGRSA